MPCSTSTRPFQEPTRVTLAHKPLVLGCNDEVCFVPRLFLGLNLSHTVVGAMNLTPSGKSYYNGVLTHISSSVVTSPAKQIKCGGLADASLITEGVFHLPDGSSIQPEIVLLAPAGLELLAMDVENASAPFLVSRTYMMI